MIKLTWPLVRIDETDRCPTGCCAAALLLCLFVAACAVPAPAQTALQQPITRVQSQPSPRIPSPAPSPRRGAAPTCYEATILSPQPFLGNHGEVARLSDGSLWEIQFEYEYLYEYYPTVVVCPANGRLHVRGKSLNVSQISPGRSSGGAAISSPSSGVVESRIDGEFEGWDGETVFRLQNGQIWQQTSYAYRYHYAYSPRVTIIRIAGRHEMMVEGIDARLPVQRLR